MRRRSPPDPESRRLAEDARRQKNWKRWGPYLAERQWGTVREDYSADGESWAYFPHAHAASRAYRWGEDGLLGVTDRECRLCFAWAFWNERDPILKERLFGLTGPQGNHGEDVKECYFYLDSTPTHTYFSALYKYPQTAFPYDRLVEENRRRGRGEPEFELVPLGAFDGGRYFDVLAEYAKAAPDDLLIRLTIVNRASETAALHALPIVWFRNTWSWGCRHEGCEPKPRLALVEPGWVAADHVTLGRFWLAAAPENPGGPPRPLFTDNESNLERLYGVPNASPYVKDAIHAAVIGGTAGAVNPRPVGTKAALHYRLALGPGERAALRLRLCADGLRRAEPFGPGFDRAFQARRQEADHYYEGRLPAGMEEEARRIARQAYAGLLWNKQFYHYVVKDWLEGDPDQPPPPPERRNIRNQDWTHLFNRDVISMPDKWEYPWYAAWDLAFHAVAFARIDPQFAKEQLILFLREWYMHPNGQLPAYEFNLSDVNPPVHAWACWRVYKMTAPRGRRDRMFLSRVFQKLLINFTWWVNRKDEHGRHIFSGGFLGLDNIGVFDRSKPLPTGGRLEQADGTAWMAFYCATMMSIALELAERNPACEDVASKFFEHFVAIADAMNTLGGAGLWDETDGFYYDQIQLEQGPVPLRVRSIVGLLPLVAVEILEAEQLNRMKGFTKRLQWFLDNRKDLARHIAYMDVSGEPAHARRLLAIPSRDRLCRVLRYLLDEEEFLSPFGIRSLSRYHLAHPYRFNLNGEERMVAYVPGESDSGLFGGNSNWRGPIWMPLNYLLIEALERYHHFYGDSLKVECPTGSGRWMNLKAVAQELAARLARLFLPGPDGARPCLGGDRRFVEDPAWRDMLLFHEYFHAETGEGLGASHQTGWTALVAKLLEDYHPRRDAPPAAVVGGRSASRTI